MPKRLRIGTRASPLALAQTREVAEKLRQAHAHLAVEDAVEIVVIRTTGDHILDRPLQDVGGKGLFTKEIEEALLENRIDLAVHSMKDMPTTLPAGLVIGAMPEREDPRDTLISDRGRTVDELARNAVVGTASLRRGAQIRAQRPDIRIVTIRGSVQTRLRKLAEREVDATVLAQAGLNRLQMKSDSMHALSTDVMLPAVAQGAIGVECRAGDESTLGLMTSLNHPLTAECVNVERLLLARLDGSCRTPIAGYCSFRDGRFFLDALVAKPDGSLVHRRSVDCSTGDVGEMGRQVGDELAALIGPEFFVV